ncbi:MAG: PAS domain S-box protein, partial [Candidatus Marinimicrobia bacterium]|nr:PAS domain S-box protein [Candidatus Neomarinimicrobiota bacterium]
MTNDQVRRRKQLRQISLALLYFIAALLAIELTKESGRIASIWFANALVVAVLLKKPPSEWAGWLVAAFIGNISADLLTGDPPLQAVILSLCNTIEIILVCALASLGQKHDRGNLTELRSLSQYLFLGVVLGSAVAAFLASLTLNLLHGIPIGQLFWTWFIADALGLVIIVPLLVGVSFAEARSLFSGSKRWESISLVILVPALTFASFSLIPDQFHLLLLVLAVATTLRLGYVGATVYIFLMTIAGIISIVFFDGHIGSNLSLRAEISLLQLFSFINVLIILPIAILMRTAKNNELRYRNLVEGTTDLVTRVDMSGKFIFVNHMAEKVLGLNPKECVSLPAFDFVHEEDRESTQAWFDEWTRTNNSASGFENRQVNKKTSEVLWMLWTADMEFDDAGAPVAINSIGRDITKRKQAEESLQKSEEQKQAIADYTYDWESWFAPDEGLLWVNPAVERLTGFSITECKEMPNYPLPIVYEDDQGVFGEHLQQAIAEQNSTNNIEFRISHKDGSVRWMGASWQPIFDSQKRYLGQRTSMRDITERRQAEQDKLNFEKQILQTQKLESLGVLAGGIAHDFNNILMGILGYADLALSELDSFNPARTFVEGINDSSRKAAALVKQMLAYSGKGKFSLEPINLNAMIEDMAQMLAISITKNVVMKFNYSDEPVFLEGDPSQIRQIIMNMVINASEAIGKKSGVISLTTGSMYCDHEYIEGTGFEAHINRQEQLPEGMYLFLEISDSGMGMSKGTIAKIFEPFFTTKFTGRGLGLSAVLGIVGGHHGMVKMYSEEGKGTTFKVLFPLFEGIMDSKSRTANSLDKDQDWQGQGTFLIADDEEAVRTVGKHMINKLGYDVLTADDGQQAVEIFKEHAEKI